MSALATAATTKRVLEDSLYRRVECDLRTHRITESVMTVSAVGPQTATRLLSIDCDCPKPEPEPEPEPETETFATAAVPEILGGRFVRDLNTGAERGRWHPQVARGGPGIDKREVVAWSFVADSDVRGPRNRTFSTQVKVWKLKDGWRWRLGRGSTTHGQFRILAEGGFGKTTGGKAGLKALSAKGARAPLSRDEAMKAALVALDSWINKPDVAPPRNRKKWCQGTRLHGRCSSRVKAWRADGKTGWCAKHEAQGRNEDEEDRERDAREET